MKYIQCTWKGTRPLVQHNGQMCDPANPFARKIKAITKKGSAKLTDADYDERDWLEWQGGLYWDDELGLIIPSENIEATIRAGARKSRIGKDVEAAIGMDDTIVQIQHRKQNLSKEKLYELPEYKLKKPVVVQRARIVRVRPMIPKDWTLTFTLNFDERVIASAKAILTAMLDAGAYCGIGDHRPRFGLFNVENFKEL